MSLCRQHLCDVGAAQCPQCLARHHALLVRGHDQHRHRRIVSGNTADFVKPACVAIALRIKPDAVLADLMLETIDAGGAIADKLRTLGGQIPIYIVSAASDALVGSVGLRELGISGVFLKPGDPAVVIQTLRTRLGVS